jgi:heptosyltransferase-2
MTDYPMSQAHNRTIHKILIIAPAWVGDMVMAQTLFKLLKEKHSGVVIDVVAPKTTLPLLARMREVNDAIELTTSHGEFGWSKRYHVSRTLRQKGYDQAIVLTNSFKSAFIPFFAQIPLRTGWRGECRYGLLNDLRYLDRNQLPLMIQRFMNLGENQWASVLSFEQSMRYWPILASSAEDQEKVRTKLNLTLDKPVLALCPGAEYGEAKRWPAEYFAQLANEKRAQGWQVWILGGPKDAPIAQAINEVCQEGCINLCGRTSLPEAIDALAMASLVVSNDSGLMHISAALQRPLVVIYGSSSPAFTPPLAKNVQIVSLQLPCSPCFKRVCPLTHLNCLRQLTPPIVMRAIEQLDDVPIASVA